MNIIIPFPQEHENKAANDNWPDFEYTGKRKTLATYSIMNDPKGWLVLCYRQGARSQWVTWYYNAEDKGYYSGNYFQDEVKAREDFKKRINQLTIH